MVRDIDLINTYVIWTAMQTLAKALAYSGGQASLRLAPSQLACLRLLLRHSCHFQRGNGSDLLAKLLFGLLQIVAPLQIEP